MNKSEPKTSKVNVNTFKQSFRLNKKTKRNRDEEGKFISGTGGLGIMQKINWERALPVIFIVALVGGFLVLQGIAAPPSDSTWKLAWSDEFEGTSLDTTKWTALKNSNYGSGNRQDECNRAENVSVSGGALNITGKKETVQCGGINPDGGSNTYYFTSGMVTTRAVEGQPVKFKYKHGYIEARIKSPRGVAYWPAFWLVGPNDGSTPGHPMYGEFDIYEGLGGRPDSTIGTGHFQCNDGTKNITCNTTGTNMYNFKTGSTENAKSDWGALIDTHTKLDAHQGPSIYDYVNYGFEWDDKKIAWYVNGTKIRYMDDRGDMYARNKDGTFRFERNIAKNKAGANGTFNPSLNTVFNYDHSIILNLAIGGNMTTGERGGYTGNETSTGYKNGNLMGDMPGIMQVDYVRVYKKDVSGEPVVTPVASPSSLKVTPGEKSVAVSWQKPADGRANQYRIRYIKSSSTQKGADSAWTYTVKTTNLNATIAGLEDGVSYDFQAQALDSTGAAPASAYTATVEATPKAPIETGLRAAYFPKGGFTAAPVYRIDKTIDFDWGWNAPVDGMDADFHARWSGKIIAPVSGLYTFTTLSDDGINLRINNKQVVDSWKSQMPTEKSGTIQLEAGKEYRIEVEYFDSGAGATAKLFWQYSGISRQIVPSTALRPETTSGLSGRYHSAAGSTLRNDKTINFDLGTGSFGPSISANSVLVNWVGSVVVPQTGDYTFTSRNDDGFILHINGVKVIDDWNAHSVKETSGTIRLEAGKQYSLYALYYEAAGNSVAQLYWKGPGITKAIVPESALSH